MTIRVARDYKDALRYQSRRFWGRPRHLVQDDDIQLGRVVFHVRKTLSEIHDPKAPALTDEAATVLPVGTPVYEVIGYPADRCLAAKWNDRLHVYDADEKQS